VHQVHYDEVIMPTLVVLGNLKIQMFALDHRPPHFHIVTPDGEAVVAIDDFRVLQGSLRSRDLRMALVWARANKARLENEWQRLQG
jgi:hypothetical protein